MTDKPQTPTPIAICMGSQSDWPTMQAAKTMLDALDVGCDVQIISAHRTPDRLTAFKQNSSEKRHSGDYRRSRWGCASTWMIAAHTIVPVL